jgi:predicted membrane GTPase involved in stress response
MRRFISMPGIGAQHLFGSPLPKTRYLLAKALEARLKLISWS